MDEEENFAKLLSQSTSAPAPSWSATAGAGADDPWANPFSDTPPTNPFASSSTPFGASSAFDSTPSLPTSSYAVPDSPREEKSPYVQKLEDERMILPDPPSVIAAREQERDAIYQPYTAGGYDSPAIPSDPFTASQSPFESPARGQPPLPAPQPAQPVRKGLPSGLIDDDLLSASDPSLSLKKAFVKSTPSASAKNTPTETKPKAYVFSPKKDVKQAAAKTEKGVEKEANNEEEVAHSKQQEENPVDKDKSEVASQPKDDVPLPKKQETTDTPTAKADEPLPEKLVPPVVATSEPASTPSHPTSIPLPASAAITPTPTRPPSPPAAQTAEPEKETPEPFSATLAVTPSTDRVAVSPLDPPPNGSDYGFQSLSIGASSFAPPPPSKSPVRNGDGWSSPPITSPPASRFGGKGWGAMDEDDDNGLFGRGGPSSRNTTGWGGNDGDAGWGEPGVAGFSTPGPSSEAARESDATPPRPVTPPRSADSPATTRTPRTPKLHSKPLFQISVGDPTRVGDAVRGYTVYTVRTRTTSPHYRKGDFSVLRRFSDFLWLFETLTLNNPGVIIPPVPDKHPFGRFQDTFIETRRLALQSCLTKITSHPVLQLDPDLRLFLESDQFAAESKNRRAEIQQDKSGLLSGWTGPKFVEQDDWFDSRRAFLDSLESQLKALSKSIENASKSRLDMAISMGDFASSMTALADSDLGSAMCSALARLSDLAHREKETNEEHAKSEVVHLLNLSDEYVRFISSVRVAFASRVKTYERWQLSEREVVRLRQTREKARQQGKLGDRVNQSLAEIGEAERRSRDASAEFEAVSKLVKNEFGRFERERVEEFKRVLERYLDGQIVRQKDLIEAWEEYHGVVLSMVQKAQGQAQAVSA